MPVKIERVDLFNQLKSKVVQQQADFCKKIVRMWLDPALSLAYSRVVNRVKNLYISECRTASENRMDVLNLRRQQHSSNLNKFDQETSDLMWRLETSLHREYGPPPQRESAWGRSAPNDPHSRQRETRRNQLIEQRRAERALLAQTQDDSYRKLTLEETEKERRIQSALASDCQTIENRIDNEQRRIREIIIKDEFITKYLQNGLNAIRDAVSYFVEQHAWATADDILLRDIYATDRLDAPWNSWYDAASTIMQSVGSRTWGMLNYASLSGYTAWVAQDNPLDTQLAVFDQYCQRSIPTLTLSESVMTANLRNYLYSPDKLSQLYPTQQRSGIKNFAYTHDERDSIDLCFRRVDWLRVIEASLPWSTRYASKARDKSMSPVLTLSLDEAQGYLNDVGVIVLNVGTEEDPIWTLMHRSLSAKWTIFIPSSDENDSVNGLSGLIQERVSTTLGSKIALNFAMVNLDKHDTEEQNQRHSLGNGPSGTTRVMQLWTAVLASRVLPFCLECNTVKGAKLDNYRNQLPLSVLMESALGSAVLREDLHPPYKYRQEISKRYAQRVFWNNPGTLDQAWSFSRGQLNDIKICLQIPEAGFWNMQKFLAAVDAGAMTLRTKKDELPTWTLSPTKTIFGLGPSDNSRPELIRSDFYYAMTVVYQQYIERLDIDDPMNPKWISHWADCAHEFTVDSWSGLLATASAYSSQKGIRHLIDSYPYLKTVAPVSIKLPALLKYTASCAARNRLMKGYFSKGAIDSPIAMDKLWDETELHVLTLLTRVAAMNTPQDIEYFCDQFTQFIGAQGNQGWIQEHCIDKPAPKEQQQNFIWEFAQIAQMGVRGLEVIFKQWSKLPQPLSSLMFDLNGQITTASEYIDRIKSYAAVYNKHCLSRLNFIMPIQGVDQSLALSMSSLMIDLDKRPEAQANKADQGLYLYNMVHQPVNDRIMFLTQLLKEAQSKAIITMITIPQYDLAAEVASLEECRVHDLYRQIQNTILNNQRLKKSTIVKANTEQLRTFVRRGWLPNVNDVRDVQDDLVVLPSETDAEYIVSGGAHGIQQQLQQAQQQQRQVAQQQHVELAKNVEVETELQIGLYRSKGKELWTKETIDHYGREYWDQLPVVTRALSGFDDGKESPLKALFNAWVGSEHSAAYVVKYMEPEAAEKIMKYAPVFRYGLYHDNLPPGFFLARRDDDLVLCFDRVIEQEEMNTIANLAFYGRLTPRQARKIILSEPAPVSLMPGGDDRQFGLMPQGLRSEQVNPGYWRHLVNASTARDEFLDAARGVLNENENATQELLDARVQASLQVSAFQHNKKPLAVEQVDTVRHLQQWASSFVSNTTFIEHLFLHDREQNRLDEQQTKKLLHAFGQITHAYDSLPVKQDQQGSCQFMYLIGEFERTFSGNVDYLYIWRDRLLTPLSNWTSCLSKREIDAMVQCLRVLCDKPPHSEFWWRLVDRHGATVGPMQYAPLWASCYQLMQYIDEQGLNLSPGVMEQWKTLLQSESINGQVLLERIQSVLRRIAYSAIDGSDAKKYQQLVLNHLNEIDWNHDGLFYASRYDALSGFWDSELAEQHFDWSTTPKKSYFPSFDQFQHVENSSVEDEICQEYTSTLRYLTRHYSNDAAHYWDVAKPIFRQYWFRNDAIKTLDSSGRIAVLRLFMKSFVLGQDRIESFTPSTLYKLIELAKDEKSKGVLLQLSQFGSLDNAAFREVVWPVRFEHLVLLVKGFATNTGQKLLESKQVSIQLLRYAEIALNCFNSDYFKAMATAENLSLEQLIAEWLDKQQTHPYLLILPWLIIPVIKQPPSFNGHHNQLMLVHANGAAEYTRLSKQMQSIDYTRCSFLPPLAEISARLPLQGFWSKSLKKETRVSFIDYASQQGCCIIDQGQGFRLLTDEERNFIDGEFQRRMGKSAYFGMNKALFQQVIQHLAIPEQPSIIETHNLLGRFIDVFILIHNKSYYNELGQVFGTMLGAVASKGPHPEHYYSLPQLHEWLSSLATANIGHVDKHYPVHLLKELLHAPGNQTLMSPGLLKPINRLHECQGNSPSTQTRRGWLQLCHSNLPNQYSALIARLMVNSQILGQLANDVKTVFEKPEQSPRFLEALYSLLHQPTVLDGRFPNASIVEWFTLLKQPTVRGIDATMHQQAVLQLTVYLNSQLTPKRDLAGEIDSDWAIPIEAIERVKSQINYSTSFFGTLQNPALTQKKLILLAYATQGKFKLPSNIDTLWQKLDADALQVIIDYYQSGAHISLVELMTLLSIPPVAFLETPSENESVTPSDDESRSPQSPITNLHVTGVAVARYNKQQMLDRLHHFETVVQGTKTDGAPKRIYSAPDTEELLRVISGFEQKGEGSSSDAQQQQLINLFYYMNEYSQLNDLETMGFSVLQATLHKAKDDLVICSNPNAPEAQQASARMLACMRELYLRRSGKWVNHTQMLTLLYSACHNDESLLYQVRTGQGKSILTLMRASYLALTGKEAYVFSAKESLSSRDFREAKSVFDAMDIPCGYITPNSNVAEYKQRKAPFKGAINFATLGNFSLFLSRNAWMDSFKIKLESNHCVAFLDESDHILFDDQTQFNFPDPGADRDAYNFEEWVYRIIYQYYRDEIFSDPDFIESNKISRRKHLDKLSEKLTELRTIAPQDSKFFGRHVLPAITAKGAARAEALAKRDSALVYLLKAAHAAHHLNEGVDFCSNDDNRTLLGQVVPVRILQVMISNQVQEGATYSDGVHQMLCVRKNEEASQQGKTPNYFVDPDSKIVLSQNCLSILLKHFKHIEGCTGTAGNTPELKAGRDIGITHVLKLPPHEQVRTQFLRTLYARDLDTQVDSIVEVIRNKASRQPMLITCKDDIEVKRLYQLVKDKIQAQRIPGLTLIRDTNDSDKTEADIVPIAGAIGSVVFSSRMGRGTDIKPESQEGLFVLRTYLASARVTKQELGRQGRNGKRGVCQTIINIDALNKEYDVFQQMEGGQELLDKLLEYETKHLDAKIIKHQKKGSDKFEVLADPNNESEREAYLKSRVFIQFRHQLQQKQNLKLRRYESMIAWMCMAIETSLRDGDRLTRQEPAWSKNLKDEWQVQREVIDGLWQKHLTAQKNPHHEVQKQQWLDFVGQVGVVWGKIVHSARSCPEPQAKKWAEVHSEDTLLGEYKKHLAMPEQDALIEQRPPKELKSVPHMSQFINFHQKWMEQAVRCRKACLTLAEPNDQAVLKTEFDEPELKGLNKLFLQLRDMHQKYLRVLRDNEEQQAERLFAAVFNQVFAALASDLLFMIPSRSAGRILFQWMDKVDTLLHSLPDDFDETTIEQRLYPLHVLTQALCASPEWMGVRRLQPFEPMAPTRYANLLDLLTQMTFTVNKDSWQTLFVSKDSTVQRFLEHVSHTLVNEYWFKLYEGKFLKRIRQFLTLSVMNSVCGYNIEMLARAFPTQDGVNALLNLIDKADLDSVHVRAFHDYVDAHATTLVKDDYCSVLPVVVDLTLGEHASEPIVVDLTLGERSSKPNQLPPPDFFMKPTVEDGASAFCTAFDALSKGEQLQFNRNFWTFLSQRRPLLAEEINQFYQFIQNKCTMDEAHAVLQLPSYIPLSDIQNQLKTAATLEKDGALMSQINILKTAAHRFNQWLASQGYIHDAVVYSAFWHHDAERWQTLFESLPAIKAECLSTMLYELHIPGDLPDCLFTQLKKLIINSKLPLDKAAWFEYGKELMVLLTMPSSWMDALVPCLDTLPKEDHRQQVSRAYFLRQMANYHRENDSLPESFMSFPSNYYAHWEKGLYDDETHVSLMNLYHRGVGLSNVDQRHTTIARALDELLDTDDETTQDSWVQTVRQTAGWLETFCDLPEPWYQSLSNAMNETPLTDPIMVQELPLLFATLRCQHCLSQAANPTIIAPLLLSHWINTAQQEQTLRVEGLKSVINIAAGSSLVESRLDATKAYLSKIETPLEERFVLLKHQEQLFELYSATPSAWHHLLEKDSKEALESGCLELIQKRQLFLKLLRNVLPETLSGSSLFIQSTLGAIWDKMLNEPLPEDETALKGVLQESLQMLLHLDETPVSEAKECFFTDQYKQCMPTNDAESIALLKQFMAVVPDGWPKESYEALWSGVTQQVLLFDDYESPRSLHRAISLIQEGLKKEEASQLQASWFTSVEQRSPRTELMRGLYHGYLSLGTEGDKSCWDYFTQMVRYGLSYVPKHFGARYHHSAMEGLGRICRVLHEFSDISKIPGLDKKATNAMQKENRDMPNYDQSFSALKSNYDDAWWKNSERKRQASQLFSGIENINKGLSRDEYYIQVMQHIVATQKDIIESDQKSFIRRNKKGYSRLYDLTTQMLVEVASDYLNDNSADLPAKEDRAIALRGLLGDLLTTHNSVRQQYGLFDDKKTQQHPALRYLDDAIAALKKGPSLGVSEE